MKLEGFTNNEESKITSYGNNVKELTLYKCHFLNSPPPNFSNSVETLVLRNVTMKTPASLGEGVKDLSIIKSSIGPHIKVPDSTEKLKMKESDGSTISFGNNIKSIEIIRPNLIKSITIPDSAKEFTLEGDNIQSIESFGNGAEIIIISSSYINLEKKLPPFPDSLKFFSLRIEHLEKTPELMGRLLELQNRGCYVSCSKGFPHFKETIFETQTKIGASPNNTTAKKLEPANSRTSDIKAKGP